MGSRRLITVLLVCLFIYNDIKNAQANVENQREERREYQYQRSSKVVGGSGYYNRGAGNVEETATNVDAWTQRQRDQSQIEGMAAKLRSELSTAKPGQYYQTACNTICAIVPGGFVGRTQEEIDTIAKEMTTQIIADLQSGKLVRSQMNQPNWFEHQVAQKIIELRKHHQEQYEQNVFRASSRFHENQGSQVQPNVYVGGRTYTKDTDDVQQQQENVFSEDDLRQIQQNIYNQRQHQQQGSFYQQQSQNQQHTVYTRPVQRYYNTQTSSRDRTNEERTRTVYPTPVVVTNNEREERNFTSSSNTASVPQVNVYNQYGRRDEEMEDRQYTQTQPTVPSYDRTYYTQKEFEERQRNRYRPVTVTYPATSQTIETSQTVSERERTIPVVIPTQQTVTTNVQVEQEEKEVRRQPQLPPRVYNYGREEKTEERETYHRNRQNIVPPTRRTSYEVRNTEQEEKVVEVHTPSPVPVTSNKHSIYSHVEESEVVPNYSPRVVIDKNTEFEVLDHRREQNYRPQVPITQTHTTVHESEQEERRRHHQVPVPTRPSTQTTYHHNEVEETEVNVPVTPRYQPSTSQHVITSETEETHTSHRPRPYPIYTNHGQTIEKNETSTSTIYRQRPTIPIYPSFKSNVTTFENGDSYVRSESHIPTTYVIEMTVEEYEERLHRLRDELVRLGYDRLTDEEYNATIATGGFTHNGYTYLYNANSGRFEKSSKIEVNNEEYEVIYGTLQQKLREIGFGQMCEQEVKQTINTGVFIRDGSKFVYDAGREQYQRIDITEHERKQIFARIQELLRRLGYRLLTQKENEGVLINGHFIRAAYQWIYNSVDGTVEKTIFVGDFAEFTDDEYREIYQKIQDTLRRIGYEQMSGRQCNETIVSGTFERGGIYWSYNPNNGEFERILLNQEEYRDRVQILRDELRRLGHRELSAEEFRKIIYQGYFYHGGYRYVFVKEFRRYERVELSAEEYRMRLRQLREQLIRIGYGTMNEAECNSTITSGKFYYGGFEWVYSFETRDYQMGNRSDIDPTVDPNAGKDSSQFDKTIYNSTKQEESQASSGNGNTGGRRRNPGIISRNRGDQPPQHFEEDYESDEILEEEPGMGYYPTGKKPEVGLATPETFEQIRETTEVPTTVQPEPRYVVPGDYERNRQRQEQHLTTQIWPTQPETISERRYHRKQTTYTQTTGLLPQQLATQATQRTTRHVPGNELGDDEELEETSTPFEPLVVSTQAYLVGNERPYNPNDQSEIIERYLRNGSQRTAAVDGSSNNYNYQQQEDSLQKSENVEDLGQQYEDFNGQQEEDVQQQLIDFNADAEDLRQEQVDVNQDYRNGQQRVLNNYPREYNSHSHAEKATADEYEAEVVQVTEKADKEKDESPGLWKRFKDSTTTFFG